MPSTFVIFDIETRHDIELMQASGYQAQEDGEFPPLVYHLPCAIAIGRVNSDGVLTQVISLFGMSVPEDDPAGLTEEFWLHADHAQVLISFNGRGFDMPVMELCALRYHVTSAKHWKDGAQGNRYRFGLSHIDLLEILSNYGAARKEGFKLGHFARLLGYAGKDGMDGSKVQGMYEAGQIKAIQDYNRLDVIRTYALFLQWALVSGRLTADEYQSALFGSKPFLDLIR